MTLEWTISPGLTEYDVAVRAMEARVAAIRDHVAPEQVWLLEHPPLYTAGTSARDGDLLNARFPVHRTGRGGQFTYHGPGQRVAYVMLDLKRRQAAPDIKDYVWRLEEWAILALAAFDIKGARRAGRVGIWVDGPQGEAKVAAVGVRVRHWVTYHGIAINRNPDLGHFDGIVPCGLAGYGVTSMTRLLGRAVEPAALDAALRAAWPQVFGQDADASSIGRELDSALAREVRAERH